MKFILKLLSIALATALAESAYYCDVFSSVSQGGIGCELEEEEIRAEENQIVLSSFNPPKTAEDIVWLEINHSNFSASPKSIFEAFKNLKRVEINNNTGLGTIETPFFQEGLAAIVIVGNDIEIVGEHAFEGLTSLKSLDLSRNKISKIHANAFKDLRELRFLNLSYNQIESLETATFSTNINLVDIRLAHNKIKIVQQQLFLTNTLLTFVDLHANEISQIGIRFTNGLTELDKIDLRANKCIDDTISPVTTILLDNLLKNCFINN